MCVCECVVCVCVSEAYKNHWMFSTRQGLLPKASSASLATFSSVCVACPETLGLLNPCPPVHLPLVLPLAALLLSIVRRASAFCALPVARRRNFCLLRTQSQGLAAKSFALPFFCSSLFYIFFFFLFHILHMLLFLALISIFLPLHLSVRWLGGCGNLCV